MSRELKCILCETIHISKQEMDEHMRSMLHHRELEKLKGRDCGHECRVCKVTLVSLTDYASHISSPTHKQNVETVEQKPHGNDTEDYFDQALVDLIEKRKRQIRNEEAAAAAKLAAEEDERRKKEVFQQRLQEAKERYKVSSKGFSKSNQWYRSNGYNARSGETQPRNNNKQGKSATWHAQEPPNLQKWTSGEFSGGRFHSQEGWNKRQYYQGEISGNQQSRFPWLSNGGSRNGVYGQNNISQYPQRSRPLGLLETPVNPPLPSFFAQALNQFQNSNNDLEGQRDRRLQNGEGQTPASEHSGSKGSKTFGSNPKLDKACRWSPYPVTKGESISHKDNNPNLLDKSSKGPVPQKHDKKTESSASNRLSRPEKQNPGQASRKKSVEEKGRHKINPKTKSKDGGGGSSSSSSSSRSSSAQRDGHQNSLSGPFNERANKPLLNKDWKMSSAPCLSSGSQPNISSSKTQVQSKPTTKQSGPQGSKAHPVGPIQSRQERQLPESFKKTRPAVLEKKGSLDSSSKNRLEVAWQIVEEQRRDHAQSQIGVNKENSRRQNAGKPDLPESVRAEKPVSPSLDGSVFLQSLQVTTSNKEGSEAASSSREDEERRTAVDKESSSTGPDEATQAVAAGQNSESNTLRSCEAQAISESSSLSKLDLPTVFKRDLTKHISSKSKTGSHEPNLNIARRVRNVSESRRCDTEKDSGLKPTVRQLISCSGSRRNVNWEQVYQEVRKKQDKGKGMPRFGIEMVPYEQEEHSQEEDDVPLIEGFQWESLMDHSAPSASRKRSLSESSVAPAAILSLFTQRESLSSDQPGSSVSPVLAQDSRCQKEVEPSELGAEAEKHPDKLTLATVKALQRSESVLGDSSSGTEQHDGQGAGKRRRAAGDVLSPEASCVEHDNKRRKVKSKKERLQIDQLLTVSLREEELSHSLQTVDTSLIQARAALEAAYMEVQRLMVVKQQVTAEMSTLRNKRIELLKGMQGSVGETPQIKLKEEKEDSFDGGPHIPPIAPSSLHTATDTAAAAAASRSSCSPPAQRASPPSSSLSFVPVVIKEEPQSPVHVSSEMDPWDNMTHFAHSTTPELPVVATAASSTDPGLNFQLSPERKTEPSNTEHVWENFREPAECRGSSSGQVEMMETASQLSTSCTSLDSKSPLKSLLLGRRGSEVVSVVEPSVLNPPGSPSEPRNGKRVRKLKKRKALKKAQGTEQAESSDTEIDGDATKPRWLRPRRRPSAGSQVSTSTPPTEGGEDMNVEASEEAVTLLSPTIQPEKVEPSLSEHIMELPPVAFTELTLNLDSEDVMEVTAACQQPLIHASPPAQGPDTSRVEPQRLACNEVTSTSDMDICKSSENEMPFLRTLPKITKTSSATDVSSYHGEDEMPTEGLFEGHQEAVNAMQIHSGLLYTCSGDRTVRAFDLVSHKCVAVFEGHSSKVSCLLVSAAPCLHHRLYSGSSDQTIRCYSLKTQELEQQFSLTDRVLCLHSRWKTLYAGLANGTVVTFNLKTNKQMDAFECHGPRAVSCLASSQEGARKILLVGSYDSTITVRDAKSGLLLRTLEGHSKTVLCMKVVNDLVFSGSSDQCVYAHNIHTGEPVRVYKGHSHAVTVVTVLGKVMVTACLDKLVRVYDLQSHDQLQVYGGHRDMVMCMAVHKNMIYTGCYDGSVQAVKLNLMHNYRCWWHGCSTVFGVMEHLQQHLINDHTGPSLQTLKCRWKNCEELLCARSSSKQMLVHMQKHVEEETEVEP